MRRWIIVGLVVIAMVLITIAAKYHNPSQAEVPCASPPPGSACL